MDAADVIIVGVLIFGIIGDIIAWIFTASTAAIIWNIIYLILIIIGFVALFVDVPYLLIAPMFAFFFDIIIAIMGVYVILSGRDIKLITGNSCGSKCYENKDNNFGAKLLIFLFVFYIITQPIGGGLLVYAMLQ